MKKSLYTTLSIVIVLGIIGSFILLKKNNVEAKRENARLEETLDHLRIDSATVQKERWLNELAFRENGKLLSDLYLVQNSSKFQIDNFITSINAPKLIVRFSYVGCEMCIDSTLNLIKKYEKYISHKDIILWATYQNKSTLDLFLNVNKLTYQTFFIPETETVINSDRYAMPYIFVMRPKEAKVLDLFFPLKEDSDRSSDYLAVIAEKYFNKKNYD